MRVPFPKAVTVLIVFHMDFPSLLEFRRTSKESLRIVRAHLTTTLYRLLLRFVQSPTLLLAKLDRLNAVVGGWTAVAFFLRHLEVQPKQLDIFVPIDRMPPLFQHILVEQRGHVVRPREAETDPNPWDSPDEQCFSLRTSLGIVNLWQSEAHTPFLPIVSGPTSLHILYVGPRHFGCAYPSLLFNHRALVGRPDTSGFDAVVRECAEVGIDLRFFTSMWRDLAHHGPCASQHLLCPSQQRTFSDAGSLRARFSPLVDRELDAEVVWRLDYRPCGRRCAEPTAQLTLPRMLQDII